jgi:hypothetical protein
MSASGFRKRTPHGAAIGRRPVVCQAFHQMAPGYPSAQALVTARGAWRRASSPECSAADEPTDDDAPDDDWDEEEELLPFHHDDPRWSDEFGAELDDDEPDPEPGDFWT